MAASRVQVVGNSLGGHGHQHEPRGSSVRCLQQSLGRPQHTGRRGRSGSNLHPAGTVLLMVGTAVGSIATSFSTLCSIENVGKCVSHFNMVERFGDTFVLPEFRRTELLRVGHVLGLGVRVGL